METFFKYIFFSSIIFVSGCKKELQIQNKNTMFEAQDYFQQEAKVSDIPIPLGTLPIPKGITDNSYSYSIYSKIPDLILFYDFEMESYGWRKVIEFNSFETLLIYAKPNGKSASISIRPENINLNKVNVFIFFNNY